MRAHRAEQIIPSWGEIWHTEEKTSASLKWSERAEGRWKETLLGWAADVILERMKQNARRKWGANNSPLSLSSLSLSHFLSLKFLFFFVVVVVNHVIASHRTVPHKVCSHQCDAYCSPMLPLTWKHGAILALKSLKFFQAILFLSFKRVISSQYFQCSGAIRLCLSTLLLFSPIFKRCFKI